MTMKSQEPTCEYCVAGDDHKITLGQVQQMIINFNLEYSDEILNAGGFFNASDLRTMTDNKRKDNLVEISSLVFFPCLEKRSFRKDILYLGCEYKKCDDEEGDCIQTMETVPNSLLRPGNNCYFEHFPLSKIKDIESFMETIGAPKKEMLPNVWEPKDNLLQEMENFQNEFRDVYPNKIMVYGKGATLGYLLNIEGCEQIRYFFGIDYRQEKNKLRLILCAFNNELGVLEATARTFPEGERVLDHTFRESSRPRRP